MLCKGIVVENNRTIRCWLPAEPTSEFQLCRRCHFHRITSVMDSLRNDYLRGEIPPQYERLLENQEFLHQILHPAREQALLNLLFSVYRRDKDKFEKLLRRLKLKSLFPIVITKRVYQHQPGPRCKLYRRFLEDPSFYKSEHLCWNCWECISWVFQGNEPYLLQRGYQEYPLQIARFNLATFEQIGAHILKEILVSFHKQDKKSLVKITIDHFFHEFPLERVKSFLTSFFLHPLTMDIVYTDLQKYYLPPPLQDEAVLTLFKKNIRSYLKERTHRYKEELMIKTWHPKRLLTWCFDVDDLSDFTDTQWNPEQLEE